MNKIKKSHKFQTGYMRLFVKVSACALLLLLIFKSYILHMSFKQPRVVGQTTEERNEEVKEVVKEVIQEPPMKNIPAQDVLERMSHTDLQKLYHRYVNSRQVTCNAVERMGLIDDGGWEHCNDPRFSVDPNNCLVYSYGIKFDFSYDDDMAKYGCEVHSFDPSMNTSSHLRGQRVHFHNTGVAGNDRVLANNENNENWQLYSIATERKNLQHAPGQRRVDVVKMDVEGFELESLTAALDAGVLDDVRQLNFESHVAWGPNDPTKDNYMTFLSMYRKVYEHGFRIYMTHRNPWCHFVSNLSHGKKLVLCHEVHTVNMNHINPNWQQEKSRDP